MTHDPRITQLEGNEHRAEEKYKNEQEKIARETKEIEHIKLELTRHQGILSTLEVEAKRDEAGIAAIKAQIEALEAKIEADEKFKTSQAHH